MPKDELVKNIEDKDRRFRIAQTIFMIATLLALLVVIAAQQRTLKGVEAQLQQAKTVAAENTKNIKSTQSVIVRRLDCMAVFFSQRNRTNLTIDDIDKCTLNQNGDIQTFFTEENGQTETTKTEQPQSLTPAP